MPAVGEPLLRIPKTNSFAICPASARNCPLRSLRQASGEWAGQSVRYSAWTRRHYERMQTQGRSHPRTLRALAFKYESGCYGNAGKERTLYDEARVLKQRAPRKNHLCHDLILKKNPCPDQLRWWAIVNHPVTQIPLYR